MLTFFFFFVVSFVIFLLNGAGSQNTSVIRNWSYTNSENSNKTKKLYLKKVLLLFVITKSVSTKQLKVDRKDWNTGASKVQKNLTNFSRKPHLTDWPKTKTTPTAI